jgi:hypothetical protein
MFGPLSQSADGPHVHPLLFRPHRHLARITHHLLKSMLGKYGLRITGQFQGQVTQRQNGLWQGQFGAKQIYHPPSMNLHQPKHLEISMEDRRVEIGNILLLQSENQSFLSNGGIGYLLFSVELHYLVVEPHRIPSLLHLLPALLLPQSLQTLRTSFTHSPHWRTRL